jgi:hypothetical protein
MDHTPLPLLQEVFNQRGLLLAFFGALGGSVRAAVLKTTWKESLRVIFVGGAVAFGIGVLSPFILRPWIGDLPEGMAGALGTLTAAAFLIGLMAVTIIERIIAGENIIHETKEPPKLVEVKRIIKKVEAENVTI